MATRSDDFREYIKRYLELTYPGRILGWNVECTTKRNKKAKYGDTYYHNMYTMFIFERDNIVMKSIELPGYSRVNISPKKYAEFLHSLTTELA